MAIYHCSVKIGSRSNGASSVASCAYRESIKIKDERMGVVHDYSRKSGVIDSFTMTPENAPTWANDSSKLWNSVEEIEKRKDAQVFREVVVALPRELNRKQQKELVTDYTNRNFVEKGMCATVAIHETDRENPHAHIMLTTRTIDIGGFGQKQRDWNSRKHLERWRYDWSESVNLALQREGLLVRVDHRSLKDQGITRAPQIHLGKVATAMERKGMQTERGDRNRSILELNENMTQFIERGIDSVRQKFEDHKANERHLKQELERQKIAMREKKEQEKVLKETSLTLKKEQKRESQKVGDLTHANKLQSRGFSR
ncbi:MobQ family relaxase [Vibrio sp. 10N.261.46.A3]|uniref:MobQ family relaxase n=1 Tax=Vibrio sp. 10N.261.46.A3 TaxID=3229658 RepID=UPI003551D232